MAGRGGKNWAADEIPLQLKDFMSSPKDMPYEEMIARNRFHLKHWWSYVEAKRRAPVKVRNALHERAVKQLPGSYKLWYSYLSDRVKQVRGKPISHKLYEIVNNTFERALVFMHKYPRIWQDFFAFLIRQKKITRVRRTFDRALQALPITQHARIWKDYIAWVQTIGVWETAVRVYRRYLQIEPKHREEYVDYLLKIRHFNECAHQMAIIVNDDEFVSQKNKSQHALWMELCSLISTHPEEIKGLKVDAIIRSGLQRFSDEVGRLWCSLADHYVRLGLFEKARDVFEEAMETVMTVRDFSMVFDAYSQFEEHMLAAKMELAADEGEEEDEEDEADREDLDLRLARLEALMDKRPILVSSVKLRQNPHNVLEWEKRVKLFKEPGDVIRTYSEAVTTVDPMKATGKPHVLWVGFAKFYAEHGDYDNADDVFGKATQAEHRWLDNLAEVWCQWAEMHLTHGQELQEEGNQKEADAEFQRALQLIQQAVREPSAREKREMNHSRVQNRLFKSVRLWSFYCDLEENLGTLATTRAAYDKMIGLKVATARTILNYAALLKQKKYFEDSFKVYEKGLALFTWPHVKDIWLQYLQDFVERYGGRKLERARDLFEQCIADVPTEDAKEFYVLYAKLEEAHGLVRHTMSVYDRATRAVDDESKMTLFMLYIKKAEDYYGATKTRPIYERAIQVLPKEHTRELCMKFAEVERKLGEIDRARAIYAHASQFADPRTVLSLWKAWHNFEVAHGNEDTFREMLRIKRTVQARYSQTNYMAANLRTTNQTTSDAQALAKEAAKTQSMQSKKGEASAAVKGIKRKAAEGGAPETDMMALERQATRVMRETAAAQREEAEAGQFNAEVAKAREGSSLENDDDAEAPAGEVRLEFQEVPSAVFGKVGSKSDGAEPMGALARFKKAKK